MWHISGRHVREVVHTRMNESRGPSGWISHGTYMDEWVMAHIWRLHMREARAVRAAQHSELCLHIVKEMSDTHTYTHAHARERHVCVCVCVCVRVRVCVICVYIYTHTHTRSIHLTCVCIHTPVNKNRCGTRVWCSSSQRRKSPSHPSFTRYTHIYDIVIFEDRCSQCSQGERAYHPLNSYPAYLWCVLYYMRICRYTYCTRRKRASFHHSPHSQGAYILNVLCWIYVVSWYV